MIKYSIGIRTKHIIFFFIGLFGIFFAFNLKHRLFLLVLVEAQHNITHIRQYCLCQPEGKNGQLRTIPYTWVIQFVMAYSIYLLYFLRQSMITKIANVYFFYCFCRHGECTWKTEQWTNG